MFYIWGVGFIPGGTDMLAHNHLAWAASFSLGLEAHSISSIPMWVFLVETDGLVLLVILGFLIIISFIQLNQPAKNNKNKNKKEEGNLNKERVYFQTNLETNFSNSLHGYW